jgi:hypothetical protein
LSIQSDAINAFGLRSPTRARENHCRDDVSISARDRAIQSPWSEWFRHPSQVIQAKSSKPSRPDRFTAASQPIPGPKSSIAAPCPAALLRDGEMPVVKSPLRRRIAL